MHVYVCVCVWGVSLKNSSPDVYTYTCIHTCTHTCIYTHAQTHAYTHMHTHICRHTHADTHMQTRMHTCSHIHMHMHTYTCTHVYTHTSGGQYTLHPSQGSCSATCWHCIPLSLPSTSAQPLLIASLIGMCLCASPSISCDIMAVKKSVYTPTTLLVCLSHVQPAV